MPMRLPRVVGLLVLLCTMESGFGQGNDRFSDAIPVTGLAGSSVGQGSQASRESGEPGHAGAPARRSLWWTWTASTSGVFNLSAFGSAVTSADLLRIAAYTGDAMGHLIEAG